MPHLMLTENLLVFIELWQETWGSSRVTTGTLETRSYCLRKVHSPCELRGASRDLFPVASRAEVLMCSGDRTSRFLFSADMDFGDPLEFPQRSQSLSRVEKCKSAYLSSWRDGVRLPVELT